MTVEEKGVGSAGFDTTVPGSDVISQTVTDSQGNTILSVT
ncbi:Uncharacterised protein [Anaerotruncus sp. 2789STDY5834896]|uniref:Uncharacterized protein n=1 Tax=uncultured Anaerotruncus sp. TaxID=905011 RepID=A0A1C6I5D9_9FIRM|nr:Uncharacterised protein [uncultured Anaerotruncus sp.]